ncbi:MAG: aconitate hydratase AcnA [Chloroflexi bacterium]|nr:aconitate hydratase AcnA [Chloroflexota bacterium]
MATTADPFGARANISGDGWTASYYSLAALERHGFAGVDRLPMTVKVLLENVLRQYDGYLFREEDVRSLASWDPRQPGAGEIPVLPSRVVLQDFTGVPAVVDLAAMRSAMARMGGDPQRINPLVPADLVIDHSVQVDAFGSSTAFQFNVAKEYERNRERYALLRWAQSAFENFRVVPPGTGIVHQVNLEFLARVVHVRRQDDGVVAFPDTLVGTDSHTTMVNGLGVLGWGVGGIEAEAVLLGQPMYLLTPQVVGIRLHGALREGATATDVVLTVTQRLRAYGVVEKFVEFYGPGLGQLSLADRATVSNMAPEYGATASLFPIDDETLRYLRMTGRGEAEVQFVERYAKEQGLFRTDQTPDPRFTETLELDLAIVEPSLAGPKRPQDRVALADAKPAFRAALVDFVSHGVTGGEPRQPGVPQQEQPYGVVSTVDKASAASFPASDAPAYNRDDADGTPHQSDSGEGGTDGRPSNPIRVTTGDGMSWELDHGAVTIAAITSCTNTSNPSVMMGAGLVAKKAVERGLMPKSYVKTSLAPGSRTVTDYLRDSGLLRYLEAIGFHVVGYGCTTCIGNSGPLPDPVAEVVHDEQLVVVAVLSGNRNFEGRIHPLVRAAYLASPMLVVAYALAGTMDIDLYREPLGTDRDGQPVFLRDVWPSNAEIRAAVDAWVRPDLFEEANARVFAGDDEWNRLPVPQGNQYAWDPDSTYVQQPPFFEHLSPEPLPLADLLGARVLAVLGDSITTDHISPAGAIAPDAPAGRYLVEHGVGVDDFNSFGARRGNHEVMMRGTFGNIRLRNEMTPGREGDWAIHIPSGDVLRIFDASSRYQQEGTPLIVVAGKEYGSGSSRDWAAKGPLLLGVKAVLAESYERIHRSNLVGMGILPLEFKPGDGRRTLGLDGTESYDVLGVSDDLRPRQELEVQVQRRDGSRFTFAAVARVDSPVDVDYLRHGGILPMVLRNLLKGT